MNIRVDAVNVIPTDPNAAFLNVANMCNQFAEYFDYKRHIWWSDLVGCLE